ncbi:MAG: sigma-70 family RNA polymerase sigma factor [Sedimentisphaerales bacterium]|nr:sigma-70 family RNA polymerase sigma factor [Sedimentisphaerales bacterium]
MSLHSNQQDKNQNDEEFLSLFLAHQKRLLGFILTLIPCRTDAEDILQKTAMIMLRKYNKVGEIKHFGSWAIQIARYEILKYREKNRGRHVQFDSQIFERILENAASQITEFDRRLEVLEQCVGKLPPTDRQLLQLRYNKSHTIKQISNQVNRPVQGLYKAMARIHKLLRDCVERTLLAGDRA